MRYVFFLLVVLSALLTPTNVFAGGGPVSLNAFPQRPFYATKTFILETEIWTDTPCSDLKPVFTFKDPMDGDSITPFTPPTDGTYITRHYNTDQPDFIWKELCTTYAQAKSAVSKQRTAVVTVVVDGKKEERTAPVSYGTDVYSKQIQGYGRANDYDNTPQVDVINEKPLGDYKRTIQLQWQKIAWAGVYSVFARQVQPDGNVTQPIQIETTEATKVTTGLPIDSDFYLHVVACKKGDPCSTPSNTPYEYLLPQKLGPGSIVKEVFITPNITPYIENLQTKVERSDDKALSNLHQKVADLERKLDASEKKQGFLEARLNDLLGLLRRLFPFLPR